MISTFASFERGLLYKVEVTMKYCSTWIGFFFLLITNVPSPIDSHESIDISQVVQVSFDQPTRLLLLDGDDGTVACRIYGDLMSATIPRFSDNWTLESATRSLLRMKNLTAVRGIPGASMVGPVDYLGNLEEPH